MTENRAHNVTIGCQDDTELLRKNQVLEHALLKCLNGNFHAYQQYINISEKELEREDDNG